MSDKFENLLNLALETDLVSRQKTEDLNVGFDSSTGRWELIVKYNGTLEELSNAGVGVEYLIAGYAILTVPQGLVSLVEASPRIEYVEKPKQYFYTAMGPADKACISGITVREPFLSGRGVLLAVLDSGIDYRNPVFRREDGSTRIAYLWDQSISEKDDKYNPPEGFLIGAEFKSEQINEALKAANEQEGFQMVPSRDITGHGTAVAGIAAGNSPGNYGGVAKDAELLVVKLAGSAKNGFPGTVQIMRGVTYALRRALELGRPLVINLSFGNTYGSHNGDSLLERFLDNASEIGRTCICVGAGNEGNSGGHVSGKVQNDEPVELAVGGYETSLSVQIWKEFQDSFRIVLKNPSGAEVLLQPEAEHGKYTFQIGNTRLLIYFGTPTPYSALQEIYLELIPLDNYLESGVWEFQFEPVRVITGNYSMYLPSLAVRNANTGFLRPTPEGTFTIPSTAQRVITVGAYDDTFDSYADFSGRGFDFVRNWTMEGSLGKPDIVAAGVGVIAPTVFGGYMAVTGTSFATPIVSGSAALLMEWGIVRGNDMFLYGDKLKAYLRRGALPIRGENIYPNGKVGYGKLCPASALYGFGEFGL